MIYKQNGVKMMRPVLSREEYVKLRNGGFQVQNVARIRQGDEALKASLVQMNYSCLSNDDGTLKGSKRMSTTVGMDIDHLTAEEMPVVRERILSKKDELGLLMLEESARGAGYHLVFKRKPELSQEENLKWASELLEVEFDKGAKDITRVFFTTTEQELIYLDDRIFETTEEVLTNTNLTNLPNREGITNNPCSEKALEFKGIPYSSIVAEWWRRTGGEPTEGERNKRLHQLAANLRAICDDSESWLLEVMPRYGLSEQEMRSIIHSACKEPTKGSRLIDQIVSSLLSTEGDTTDEEPQEYSSPPGT